MKIIDRLFSENTGESVYSVLLTETEYRIYSEARKKSKDTSTAEELGKAVGVIGAATGAGALAGKALEKGKSSAVADLFRIGSRAAVGAGVGSQVGRINTFLNGSGEATEAAIQEAKKKASSLPKEAREALLDNSRKKYLDAVAKESGAISRKGAAVGGAIGGAEGVIETLLKKLKHKKKYTGKGAVAGAALGTTGLIAHKISKKNKKDKD